MDLEEIGFKLIPETGWVITAEAEADSVHRGGSRGSQKLVSSSERDLFKTDGGRGLRFQEERS